VVFFLFFYDFLRNYLFLFYFLILSWLKITVTICEESTVTFLINYCGLLQCFFSYGFFFCFVVARQRAASAGDFLVHLLDSLGVAT